MLSIQLLNTECKPVSVCMQLREGLYLNAGCMMGNGHLQGKNLTTCCECEDLHDHLIRSTCLWRHTLAVLMGLEQSQRLERLQHVSNPSESHLI